MCHSRAQTWLSVSSILRYYVIRYNVDANMQLYMVLFDIPNQLLSIVFDSIEVQYSYCGVSPRSSTGTYVQVRTYKYM